MTTARRVAVCAALLALSASSAVFAFPGGLGGWAQAQQRPQRERQFQPPPRRENFAPPQQPSQPMQPQGPQRMSPDERRQLRRDLHDAGRDVYPPRREWRR